MKYIEITVDVNDADYETSVSVIKDEVVDKIRPLIEAIKEYSGRKLYEHNFPCLDFRDEGSPESIYPNIDPEIIEIFRSYCPYPEGGFHTVESVKVYEKVNEEVLM